MAQVKKNIPIMDNVEKVLHGKLKPNPDNTKLHPAKQIKQIAKSIAEFGFNVPILANKKTGLIIAGHGRWMASRQLGIKYVPVIWADHMTPEQIRAYTIADNQLNLNTGFDMATLEKELQDLDKAGYDLTQTGFTLNELSGFDLSGEDREAEEEEEIDNNTVLEATTADYIIFPSKNKYGIPDLDLEMQAKFVDNPVQIWGSVARDQILGTVLFYTDDRRFESLWDNPHQLAESQATTMVEPNFTITPQHPKVVALWNTYKKRQIARIAQQIGLTVIVDLFISTPWEEINFLGVPEGWGAFATRAGGLDEKGREEERLIEEYKMCLEHTKRKSLDIFLVYGGGAIHEEICQRQGFVHIIEHMQMADLVKGGDFEMMREVDTSQEKSNNAPKKKPKRKRKRKQGGS